MKKLLSLIISLGLFVWLFNSDNFVHNNIYAAGAPSQETKNVVNVYSARKEYLIKPLLDAFESQMNIKVNLVAGKAKALQKRLELEGKNTQADILLTVDAGNLYRAKIKNLTKSIHSEKINKLIPENLRDTDGYWYGLSIRSRVIMYNPKTIKLEELSTYEDLANSKWRGRICMRSSNNIYNQSLLSSLISHIGKDESKEWADSVVKNFARSPKGNDRTQMTSVVLGECDLTLANTYYLGKWITSKKEKERGFAKQIKVFFPNQDGRGAHINISGATIIKYSKNTANAIKLIEFLAGDEAQKLYAKANHEYPIRNNIEVSAVVRSWGYPFKTDKINLENLGKNNGVAVKIFDQVNWQ
tara:strand:+ start:891 stop:1961 length:1071 start_codon:yes stop_codon:yes gene_type:complete